MTPHQISKRHSFGLLAMGVSVLVLGGCSINHPNAMPSGYTYHKDTYKSPTSPPSMKITAEQRKYMDSAQAEQFRDAVYDLLTRVTNRAGMPPKPVYILTPAPMTTFYANIDNDLREGMRHIGYAISDMPNGSYVFAYDARLLDQPRGTTLMDGQANVELVLRVFSDIGSDARMLTEESGFYYIQGAETLNIQPANYKQDLLPSREKIMQQAAGFGNRRTASETMTQTSTSPMVSYGTNSNPTTFQSAPVPQTYMTAPSGVATPQASGGYTGGYGGPTQAVMIDSSGISYDDGVSYENPQQAAPQGYQLQGNTARVSQEVEY